MAVTKKKTVSGFCNSINKQPQHEGTKPVSPTGVALPTCTLWDSCGCECHEQISKMYADIGMDREPPEQSHAFLEFVRTQAAEFDTNQTPLDPVYDALSSPGGVDVPLGDEEPSTTPVRPAYDAPAPPVPALPAPAFIPTPTGRRARGQLEYDVLQVCKEYTQSIWDWSACTPKVVAERIGKMNATEPPSTGAINAVWDRWERLKFATQDKKPSRFVKFLGEGTPTELDRLKAQVKRDRKRVQAEIKRGSLRPRGR